MSKHTHGFTLIELLVVIALIGMLGAIILAALNSARSNGGDAAVKSNLSNMRAQEEILYGDLTTSQYSNACAGGTKPRTMYDAAVSAGGSVANSKCNQSAFYWVAWVALKSDNTKAWCVDYLGSSKLENSIPASNSQACP
jgi:prepilin-type N-terminal cleavage/methylation domain-containing protein